MKISPLFLLAGLAVLTRVAAAQQMPAGDTAVPANVAATAPMIAASRVVQIDARTLSTLPALLGKSGGPGAISLRVSEAEFDADANAQNALRSWVRGGGTVFLHTGAARAFGFKTVAARLGTNAVAGQLYGRARAALPFGANPLLWDEGRAMMRRAPGADPTRFPGVNVVFYEMQQGDHLVQSHPAGTPLLEVSDLSGSANGTLFAAALAPFGRGFAVFTPDFIDPNRGDGALFTRNLMGLLAAAAGNRLVGVPVGAIENGGAAPAALQQALAVASAGAGSSPALPAFGTTPAPGAAPVTPAMDTPPTQTAVETALRAEAVVLLSRAEAGSYANLLAAGGQRAATAINLLRARLFLGRGEVPSAVRALDAGAALSPNSAEIALWRGILQIGAAQNLNQPAPDRAQLTLGGARDIAQSVAQATGGAALFPSSNGAGAGAPGGATLSGIPLAALRDWSAKLGQIAQVFALEPPLVEQYGSGSAAITVRAFANDTSLPQIVIGARALANARNFGWHGDDEEILLFPSPQTYLNYRRALGLSSPTVPLPAGAVGDVVGQRISMIALRPTPVFNREPDTGQLTVLGSRTSAINGLARLHSSVLLGAYDEAARSPAWLQLGLENLINTAIAGQGNTIISLQGLQLAARSGVLLRPDQFRAAGIGGNANTLAQAQAASLMAFFYRAYGAGAVTETVQRLGLGQNIDEVLQATTQGDQLALFQNWRAAQFKAR